MPADAPTAKFVSILSMSVATSDDAQAVMSVAWRITTHGYACNSPQNSMILAPVGIERFAVKFSSADLTDTNLEGVRHRPRMGRIAWRTFTDLQSRGAWNYAKPTYSPGGGLFIHEFAARSCFIEIRPVGPCDAEGSDAALESMRMAEDGAAADRGMWWEIEGFYVNEEARFDLVSVAAMPFRVLSHSDSNGAGNTEPDSGSTVDVVESPRAALILQGISSSSWDDRGSNAQWHTIWFETFCAERGLFTDFAACHHGGRHQSACGPNQRANIKGFWPGYYPDLIDSFFEPFPGGPSITDPQHWANGWTEDVAKIDSYANDELRRFFELSGDFGAAGENYFGGSQIQASVKALADYVTTTRPAAKMFAVTTTQSDAAGVDTLAKVKAGYIAGAPNGRGFRYGTTPGVSEDSKGLFLALSDYATGAPTQFGSGIRTHYTATEHAAIAAAIKSPWDSWFDSSFVVKYVDGANGNDANPGTYASPKKTAAAAISGATWLMLKAGTSCGSLTLAASGTSTAPVRVSTYGVGASATLSALNTNSKSNIWIYGVRVTGGTVGVTIAGGTGVRLSHVVADGNSSHGWSITGGTVTLESCEGNSNGGDGFNVAGGTITARRTIAHDNTGFGIRWTAGTFTGDGDRFYSNSSHQVSNAGATVTLRNGKIASKIHSIASLLAIVHGTAGTTVLEQMHLHDSNEDNSTASYYVQALSTNRIAWRNCVFSRFTPSDVNGLIWIGSFGASGNVDQAQNSAHDDSSTQIYRFGYGATFGDLSLPGHSVDWTTFKTWTDRSGRPLAQNSVMGATGITATASGAIVDEIPAAGTLSKGIGAAIGVSKDYFRRVRSAANAGPWGD